MGIPHGRDPRGVAAMIGSYLRPQISISRAKGQESAKRALEIAAAGGHILGRAY